MEKQERKLPRNLRERIIAFALLISQVKKFEQDEALAKDVFGTKGWGWLKTARSFLVKALQEGLAKQVGAEEWNRIVRMAEQHELFVTTKAAPEPPGFVTVNQQHLFDLAELAIWQHCQNCNIKKFKACNRYKVYNSMDLPAAHMDKGCCPYRVEVDNTKVECI